MKTGAQPMVTNKVVNDIWGVTSLTEVDQAQVSLNT